MSYLDYGKEMKSEFRFLVWFCFFFLCGEEENLPASRYSEEWAAIVGC